MSKKCLNKQYYHASPMRLPIATKLHPGEKAKVDGRPALILEQARPKTYSPREHCNYVVSTNETDQFTRAGIGFKCGFIHEIEVNSIYGPFDLFWIGALQHRHYPMAMLTVERRRTIDRLGLKYAHFAKLTDVELASRYWSGQPSQSPAWEFATTSGKVVGYSPDKIVTFGFELSPAEKLLASLHVAERR